ncbi:unnamed protein product [Danaus chrysippus]|uniref:(African queen) hypothetical protein n=1 Tax=Danaus chrysippus TaxID=151541 RepID=A0A8J2QSG1_9NEOP|nr:unnamed protein product [Danaus chrysippus]
MPHSLHGICVCNGRRRHTPLLKHREHSLKDTSTNRSMCYLARHHGEQPCAVSVLEDVRDSASSVRESSSGPGVEDHR